MKLFWDDARTREYPWAALHFGALLGTTITISSGWPTFPSTACEICQHLCLNTITNKRLLSGVLSFSHYFVSTASFHSCMLFPSLFEVCKQSSNSVFSSAGSYRDKESPRLQLWAIPYDLWPRGSQQGFKSWSSYNPENKTVNAIVMLAYFLCVFICTFLLVVLLNVKANWLLTDHSHLGLWTWQCCAKINLFDLTIVFLLFFSEYSWHRHRSGCCVCKALKSIIYLYFLKAFIYWINNIKLLEVKLIQSYVEIYHISKIRFRALLQI